MEKILTRNADRPEAVTLDGYERTGGYRALRKVVKEMTPDQVTEEVKRSGLRGRGGAGFPTGLKWSFMPKEVDPKRPHYLLMNADESEPGTFKDRLLMEKDPHLVIESCLVSSWAIRAGTCYIYIRGEFVEPARILDRAIAEARAKGYVGKNVLGSGWDCEVVVHRGAGAYICGEETALMSSLEGDRGYPRLKPPFPAASGVWGCPTTINNVETLACVPFIVERGADWFLTLGKAPKNTGPKLYGLSGHVKRPGIYEAPMGLPLMELIHELGGGMLRPEYPLKAVIPGGSSVPVLRADECEVDLDFDALAAKGTMLGSAGVMVMDASTCMVKAMERIAHFYHHESCGQCTPCRQGCGWIERVVARIEAGRGLPQDLDLLLSVSDNIMGNTICALGDAAAMPTISFVKKFRDEFQHHIDHKTCLAGTERVHAVR